MKKIILFVGMLALSGCGLPKATIYHMATTVADSEIELERWNDYGKRGGFPVQLSYDEWRSHGEYLQRTVDGISLWGDTAMSREPIKRAPIFVDPLADVDPNAEAE